MINPTSADIGKYVVYVDNPALEKPTIEAGRINGWSGSVDTVFVAFPQLDATVSPAVQVCSPTNLYWLDDMAISALEKPLPSAEESREIVTQVVLRVRQSEMLTAGYCLLAEIAEGDLSAQTVCRFSQALVKLKEAMRDAGIGRGSTP